MTGERGFADEKEVVCLKTRLSWAVWAAGGTAELCGAEDFLQQSQTGGQKEKVERFDA